MWHLCVSALTDMPKFPFGRAVSFKTISTLVQTEPAGSQHYEFSEGVSRPVLLQNHELPNGRSTAAVDGDFRQRLNTKALSVILLCCNRSTKRIG